jgi:hypothetical protein
MSDGTDEIRSRLAAADPAPAQSAVDGWLDQTVDTTLRRPREDEPRRRPRTWLLAAAAAAVVLVGSSTFAALHGSQEQPDQRTGASPDRPTVVRLAVPAAGGPALRCMPASPVVLRRADLAFAGTVGNVGPGVVTLEVDHWYHGGTAEQVELETPQVLPRELVGAVAFQKGGRYLIAAVHGRVATCGFSGRWSPGLAHMYDQAFGS